MIIVMVIELKAEVTRQKKILLSKKDFGMHIGF